MKGGQRLRFERVGEHIVAISLGSSFESSVCKSMLGLGADVAFVVSQTGRDVPRQRQGPGGHGADGAAPGQDA